MLGWKSPCKMRGRRTPSKLAQQMCHQEGSCRSSHHTVFRPSGQYINNQIHEIVCLLLFNAYLPARDFGHQFFLLFHISLDMKKHPTVKFMMNLLLVECLSNNLRSILLSLHQRKSGEVSSSVFYFLVADFGVAIPEVVKQGGPIEDDCTKHHRNTCAKILRHWNRLFTFRGKQIDDI